MKKLTVYEYPKCGTCRNALKHLKSMGYELETHNIFETAPTAEVIADLIKRSGLESKKFFNTSGEVYKEMGLKDVVTGLSEDERIALLASNGRLIKRPIVTDGNQVTVGFKAEDYDRVWGE